MEIYTIIILYKGAEVMKLRMLLVSLILLVFSFPAFAFEDYSNVKGDFKIFCLGDSKEICKDKVAYLKNKKEIRGTLRFFTYNTSIGKEPVQFRLNFKEDKLYHIFIAAHRRFGTSDYHYGLKNYYLNIFFPILLSAYGKPTKNLGYPAFFYADGTNYGSFWQLEKKVIEIGIKRNSGILSGSGGPSYYAVINIYNKDHLKENQQQQDVEIKDAAKDF
jgi:hypothetical protein